MKYFRMRDDGEVPDRWFLGSPTDADGRPVEPWVFTSAKKATVKQPLAIDVSYSGRSLDFTHADLDMPVANRRACSILKRVAGGTFESFPARVNGHPEEFEIVNFLQARACVDEAASEFLKWTETGGRPDKIGHYRSITNLRIDPSKVDSLPAFRITGWHIALIVSEIVKIAFEMEAVTGVAFLPVSDHKPRLHLFGKRN